jgi:hypothetical protein
MTQIYTYTPVLETKVYLNFDGSLKIVNRQEVHTDEIIIQLCTILRSGIKTNRIYINRNRLIDRESACILFRDMEATISTNGMTDKKCIEGIDALVESLKT